MKKFLETYFDIPEEGKIPDRVMTAWGILTLVLILLYLATMAFAAYAFYTYEAAVEASMLAPFSQIATM